MSGLVSSRVRMKRDIPITSLLDWMGSTSPYTVCVKRPPHGGTSFKTFGLSFYLTVGER